MFLLNSLFFLKKLLAAFFVGFVFKIAYTILRFVFYKVIVKAYQFYFSVVKRLGWLEFRNSPLLFLVRQKLAHIAVLAVVVIVTMNNLTTATMAEGSTEIAGKTIMASLVDSEFSDADQEQLAEEFFDEEAIISSAQEKYLENLSVVEPEPILNTKSQAITEDEEELALINEAGTAIIKQDLASTVKTKRLRKDIVYYEVESGDVVGAIADKFDLNVSTILWENNLSAYSVIRPGDKLAILPIDGLTYKIAKGDNLSKIAGKYSVSEESIVEFNKLEEARGLVVGNMIILPGARRVSLARVEIPVKQTYSGLDVLRNLVAPKKKVIASSVAGKFFWPTVGYRITQYYTWRHHGLDIANKVGTPIYAVDDGVVEISGWGTGYGNTILINHGGGRKTRYGHFSKLYVKKGATVQRGEVIGAMGSTGWSTGSHLHFEIIINGVKYNPLNYLNK